MREGLNMTGIEGAGEIRTATAWRVWGRVEERAVAHIVEGSDGNSYILCLILD
jgi:hypothetical protein